MPVHGNLGKSLIKQKQRQSRQYYEDRYAKNTQQDGNAKIPVKSITEETTLDSFLHEAELANADFTAGLFFSNAFNPFLVRKNVRLIENSELEGVLVLSEKLELDTLHQKLRDYLKIPRRPHWTKETTTEELHALENKAFYEWRTNIASISERDDVVITPYEKNLDFWRELWRVVERSDVLIQIVDARRPLLFHSQDLDLYVSEHSTPKSCVLLMNKSDLLSYRQRKAWASYFQSVGLKAIFWSALSHQEDHDDANDSDSTIAEEDTGRDKSWFNNPKLISKADLLTTLRSLDLGNRAENRAFTVGFIGYPNVGKSSTLNALIGAKKVSVSATPGHTKRLQTIYLSSDFMLCDCPGLVLPSFAYTRADLVVSGILPVDENRDIVGPVNIVCQQIPRSVLESVYGVMIKRPASHEDPKRLPTAHELLGALAYMRGFMTSKGVPNFDRAARIVLKDYVNGKLLYCHGPPGFQDNDFMELSDQTGMASFAPTQAQKLAESVLRVEPVEPEKNLVSDFDRLNMELNPMKNYAMGAYRSKRHIPDSQQAKPGSENDDQESCASWRTVDSSRSTCVGGASLLSGVGSSVYRSMLNGDQFDSVTAKQAWRRASEAKKGYYPVLPGQDPTQKGTARPRKRKEKLRKVYAHLDHTENY
ncbi:NS3 Viral polyprotein [Cichlidogyrus casuarinus]|uniref:Large subunit GTPase 1 homolog n=1 Tax=Cichlidogyrus casuarinus TaxID=1844966 RepID=A0ABD2PVE1_9PLAT